MKENSWKNDNGVVYANVECYGFHLKWISEWFWGFSKKVENILKNLKINSFLRILGKSKIKMLEKQ